MRVAIAAGALALLLPAHAHAARFAIGVDDTTRLSAVAPKLRAYGPVSWELEKLHTLVVRAPHVRGVRRIEGVRWAEWLGARRRPAFTPTDPLYPKQWYVPQIHAFDFWPDLPVLPPVRVAVVDSGIDLTHPDLATRVLASHSFVGGTVNDTEGHGTFVAGEIAAAMNNAEGIAGVAFPAQLLVAKVVGPDGSVGVEDEAQAIRWAVDAQARVINLSLGGLRDPQHPNDDSYSPLEAAAVQYAVKHDVLVVAASGNSDQAPREPWPYASYPAALPHVVGVGALARDGSVPLFSDRDPVYVDLAAPGQDILSTLPRALTRDTPTCPDQGYSDCGPEGYRHAEGTSFAAPLVAASAALLFAQDPALTADQAAQVLERTADDVNASTGCRTCPLLRDSLTGWGRVDVARALEIVTQGAAPAPDQFEPNDDTGAGAFRLYGSLGTISATIDYWDDPLDGYRFQVLAGHTLTVTVDKPLQLELWAPRVGALQSYRVRAARRALTYRVPPGAGGLYTLAIRAPQSVSTPYRLTFAKS